MSGFCRIVRFSRYTQELKPKMTSEIKPPNEMATEIMGFINDRLVEYY
jgi:hypothetical protein